MSLVHGGGSGGHEKRCVRCGTELLQTDPLWYGANFVGNNNNNNNTTFV